MSVGGKRIIIVGGGASGAILAAHLLRQPDSRVRVTIVEARDSVGRGLAYSTAERDHILNTRAGSMSAYGEDTEHFWRWLLASGASDDIRCSDPFCFVSRSLFGDYLGHLLKPWTVEHGDGRVDIVKGDCIGLRTTAGGVVVDIRDAPSHVGHAAVLATGHTLPGFPAGGTYVSAFSTPREAGIGADDPVLILGTGLSMVDCVIQLVNNGHRGQITALSRRGQLPRVHKRTLPMKIDAADVPFGTGMSYLLHWFRRTVAFATERGGDWRDVVDGMRPHTSALWQSLSPAERQRFLRHLRTWWEVHRHRLPPESAQRILAARSNGHLEVIAARFLGHESGEAGVTVRYRRKGKAQEETMRVAKVIDCTGILRDPEADREGLVSTLVAQGIARPDPLRIGLDIDDRCRVINQASQPNGRLFAVGPLTRARFWEVTAVPDIRVQSASLAATILSSLSEDRSTRPNGRTGSY